MTDSNTKKYPLASDEIAKIMGFNKTEQSTQAPAHAEATSAHPLNLPVVKEHSETHTANVYTEPAHDDFPPLESGFKSSKAGGIFTLVLPYIVVFGVGIFLYFFFFSKVDFGSLLHFNSNPKSAQETALQQLESKNMPAYNTWVKQFYYDVSDSSIVDPNADNSGNGLTNFQKFLLNLNPKSYDTLGLGMADSEALAKGINPLSGLPLNDTQKSLLSNYFDMEVIMNKLAVAKLNSSGSVAGAQVFNTTGGFAVPTTTTPNSNASSGDPEPSVLYANLDINTSVPGRLNIPQLKIDAPLVFSTDPKNFESDLQLGVIHYPGTALPGQIGTSYISGHSSNYVWAKGNYNHVFTHLNDLPDNSSFTITVVQNNGRNAILHYVVTSRQQFSPTDTTQFANTGKSTVALSTCWPVNTTQKRLVLFAELTQVEQ